MENPRHQPISDAQKQLIDKLLLAKIPLADICRASGVSKPWFQYYVNQKYDRVQKKANISEKKEVD